MKCMIIPEIIVATGIVTKGLKKNLEAIQWKHSIYSLNKKAVFRPSHIIWKVLQFETGRLSGGDRRWFNEEKESDKRHSNNNNNNNNEQYKYDSSPDPQGRSRAVLESCSPPRPESPSASENHNINVNITVFAHIPLFYIHIKVWNLNAVSSISKFLKADGYLRNTTWTLYLYLSQYPRNFLNFGRK